jgi:hypothetical protein
MRYLLFPVCITAIYLIAWIIQSHLLLNWDVSWLMHASKRMLAGGSYTQDFFEINPPMILYLYVPPVLFAKFSALSIVTSLRLYIFILASVSLAVSYLLAKKLFPEKERAIAQILIITMALAYFMLPAYEFGQREHLMLMLIMPYLFLVALRSQNKHPADILAFVIGLLAGLGFAIKPHFLVIFILAEIYYLYLMQRFFAWMRVETVTVVSICILYLASVMIWYSDYLTTIVPVVLRFYDNGFSQSWMTIVFQSSLFFVWIAIALYFVQYKKNTARHLNTLFFITLMACLAIYGWQGRTWYYHLMPVLTMALLLAALSFYEIVKDGEIKNRNMFSLSLFGLLLFSMPMYVAAKNTLWGYQYKNHMTDFIVYLKNHMAHRSFFVFASTTVYAYPIVDYTDAIAPSRFAFPGWVPGMLKRHDAQSAADKRFFMDMMMEDFVTQKPDFIFVDVQSHKNYIDDVNFQYVPYFSENAVFKQLWKSYHYVATIESPLTYKFEVYQRG